MALLLADTPLPVCRSILRELRWPTKTTDAILLLRSTLDEGAERFAPSAPAARRLWRDLGDLAPAALRIRKALGLTVASALDALLEQTRNDCCTPAGLAVSGRELVALGLRGPAVGEAQRYLLEQVLDDPTRNTPEALLELLRRRTTPQN
jgi:tRNA nucleotidyltransferase (CCA-adding enzyme)